MAFWKSLGTGIGTVTGGIVGGAVGIVGELTKNDFISEVGEGIYNSSKFMGQQLGNATQGVWDIGEGFVKKDDKKIEEGFNNIGEGVTNTGTAVFGTIKHVAKNAGDIGTGLIDDDPNRWKRGARELGKTAAIGILGVSILDVADVVDVNGNENINQSGVPLTQSVESHQSSSILSDNTYETAENPNSHHVNSHYVEGHWRDGQWIEGYWRDGDGNTNINTSSGYEQSNPNYKTLV